MLQSMLSLQSRLGDYQVIMPGRSLVKEGELLKISRKVDIKISIYLHTGSFKIIEIN